MKPQPLRPFIQTKMEKSVTDLEAASNSPGNRKGFRSWLGAKLSKHLPLTRRGFKSRVALAILGMATVTVVLACLSTGETQGRRRLPRVVPVAVTTKSLLEARAGLAKAISKAREAKAKARTVRMSFEKAFGFTTKPAQMPQDGWKGAIVDSVTDYAKGKGVVSGFRICEVIGENVWDMPYKAIGERLKKSVPSTEQPVEIIFGSVADKAISVAEAELQNARNTLATHAPLICLEERFNCKDSVSVCLRTAKKINLKMTYSIGDQTYTYENLIPLYENLVGKDYLLWDLNEDILCPLLGNTYCKITMSYDSYGGSTFEIQYTAETGGADEIYRLKLEKRKYWKVALNYEVEGLRSNYLKVSDIEMECVE